MRRFEAGGCTPEEFAAGVVDDWELDLEPAAFLVEFGGWPEPPFEGALELVAAVQATVPAGFLSNMNSYQWGANYEAIPLTEAFAYRFLSFELGLVKPDAADVRRRGGAPAGPARPGALPRRQRGQRGGGRGSRLRGRHVRGVDGARAALGRGGHGAVTLAD